MAASYLFIDVCNRAPHKLQTNNHWCSVDAHYQDVASSLLLTYSQVKAANTSIMYNHNLRTWELPHIPHINSLRLHFCSFSECCNDRVVLSFLYKGLQSTGYAKMLSTQFSITVIAIPQIVDVLFTFIFISCLVIVHCHQSLGAQFFAHIG